jgi:scyllo-inositol 2-dehydrogenase (NADP+)
VRICVALLGMVAVVIGNASIAAAQQAPGYSGADFGAGGTPMRVGIVGMVHGHIEGFLRKSNLTPAGGILERTDVQLVGVVEKDAALFEAYAKKYHLPASLHYASIAEMVAAAHPTVILAFTATSEHRRVVEESAALGVHVMVEKPLATSYADAVAIAAAAKQHHVHVLVDLETTWYASTAEAFRLLEDGALGPVLKTVVRDGHEGPKQIGVQPEFLAWLTDPVQNGAGALFDFGCYGANLMTALMHGEKPLSVMAVTKHLQPEFYPHVDDEAEIILNYRDAVSIIEASWNWPFGVKQMDVYGRTGYAKTIDPTMVEVRKAKEAVAQTAPGAALRAPYDDPLHYMAAVLKGTISEDDSLSSLKTNVTVMEILEAARQSAASGKAVKLPLEIAAVKN